MFRMTLAICGFLTLGVSLVAAADTSPSSSKLTAAEIIDRNVAARGGLQAWRAVQTISLAGKLGAGGNQRATLQVPVPGPGPSATMRPTPRPCQ